MVKDDETVVRRTPDGWRVGHDEVADLTSAMVLADILAAEAAAIAAEAEATGETTPISAVTPPLPPRPTPAADTASQAERLEVTVAQLQHALTARVLVEQAIGVLAERLRLTPRRAFERLRQASRSRGQRVHDLAHDVVASTTNPLLPIPPELARVAQPTGRHQRPSRRSKSRQETN